jgi:peptidylprolyl isomerase
MIWNNRWIPVLFIAAGVTFATNGWGATATSAPGFADADSGALAVIGGKTITIDYFRAEMARRRGAFDAKRKEELLDSMVRSEILYAAAKSAGYENDPDVFEAIKQVMVGKYLRDNLEPKLAQLKASDQEAEAYYLSHQAEFGKPAMTHAALIRIAVSPKASDEKRAELLKRAESARAEALALEPGVPAFGSVAVKYSEDQDSRYRGGDIGWLPVGTIDHRRDAKVSEAISGLKSPGEVSPVITAGDGYYIVKLIETKGATVRPFAEVKDGVRYQVVREKKKRLEFEFIDSLKNRMPVTVNSGLLQTIASPVEVQTAEPPALPAR